MSVSKVSTISIFTFLLTFPFKFPLSTFPPLLCLLLLPSFPIKFSSGNCFRYWRNPAWNSALHCIKHQPEHCTGLQSMCTGESQSIALHCNLIARTLGGSGWKSAGARRIQNFGFWPQWPLFLRIRNVGMGWVGGWRWARVALFLSNTFNCNLLSLAQQIALSSISWNDIK